MAGNLTPADAAWVGTLTDTNINSETNTVISANTVHCHCTKYTGWEGVDI